MKLWQKIKAWLAGTKPQRAPFVVKAGGRFALAFEFDHYGKFYITDSVTGSETEFTATHMWTMLTIMSHLIEAESHITLPRLQQDLFAAMDQQSNPRTMLTDEVVADLRMMVASLLNIQEALARRTEALRRG